MISEKYLRFEEKAVFALRELYESSGYTRFSMSKFEEYDLYAGNKDFLVSDNVITFTDTDGRLMALKPDVTLSIVRNTKDAEGRIDRLYYNENVYRVSPHTHAFKEILQTGLECIGQIGREHMAEVLGLAAKSLELFSDHPVLDICHLGIVSELLEGLPAGIEIRREVISCISDKNVNGIEKICKENAVSPELTGKLSQLAGLSGNPQEVLPVLRAMQVSTAYLEELESILKLLSENQTKTKIRLDFSVIDDMNYYQGLAFRGYVEGVPESVLSGGRYDGLMKRMGRKSGAIGFAVYLDPIKRLSENSSNGSKPAALTAGKEEKQWINIALPKGRLGEKVYRMLEQTGFSCPGIMEDSRKLIFENEELGIRYFWAKPSDVAIYVERGAADVGIVGKDILLEYKPDLYELLDLGIGKCRMAVAGRADFTDNRQHTLRVATKFENIAKAYYASLGRDIDIIHLNGSIEIAPILDLSDVIVDIVETGTTLKENNLVVRETIVPISARLVANKASCKYKKKKIDQIREGLEKLTAEG